MTKVLVIRMKAKPGKEGAVGELLAEYVTKVNATPPRNPEFAPSAKLYVKPSADAENVENNEFMLTLQLGATAMVGLYNVESALRSLDLDKSGLESCTMENFTLIEW